VITIFLVSIFGNKKLEKNVKHVACLYEQYIEKTCVSF